MNATPLGNSCFRHKDTCLCRGFRLRQTYGGQVGRQTETQSLIASPTFFLSPLSRVLLFRCVSVPLWFTGLGLAAAAPAGPPSPKTADEIIELDPVEVTGSIIKRAEVEGPAPVKTITRAEIEESAYASFSDLMLQLPEVGYSSINESSTGAIRGGAALSLRGFGSTNTLILVDGRRATLSGVSDYGVSYVDQNRFPATMVERVEILQDCGAIYGSGAAAGVVNIILRKDYTGAEITARYGNSLHTDVGEKSFSVLAGASNRRTNATAGFTYFARGALHAMDTTYANNADLTDRYAAKGAVYAARVAAGDFDLRSDYGPQARIWLLSGQRNGSNGVNVPGFAAGATITRLPGLIGFSATSSSTAATPSFTVPAIVGTGGQFNAAAAATFVPQILAGHSNPSNLYNTAEATWLTPKVERSGVNLSFRHTLSSHATAYARFAYQHNWSYLEMPQYYFSQTAPRSNYWNPFGVDVGFYWRPTEMGPQTSSVIDQTLTGVVGVRGIARGRWQWDTGYSYSHSQNTEKITNFINRDALRAALALTTPDALNVFGGAGFQNNPTTLASIRAPADWQGKSELQIWDARISGDLVALPTGMMSGGLYAEFRREAFFQHPMTTDFAVLINGLAWNAIPGRREVLAGVAEVHAPLVKRGAYRLLHGADLSVAVRFDRYSEGYASGLKPYAGLRVQPAPWLALRTSYARTFLSPTLEHLYGQSTDSYSTALPDLRRPQALTGDPFDGSAASRLVRAEGNPHLRPVTSQAWQYGFVLDVPGRWLKGLTLGATYLHLEQSGVVVRPGTTWIRQNEVGGGAAELVVRESGAEKYTNTTRAPIAVLEGPDGATTLVAPGQTVTVPGRIAYLSNSYVNLSARRAANADFSLAYVRTVAGVGRFSLRHTVAYAGYLGSAMREDLLVNTVGRTFSSPRVRMQSSLSWARRDWSAVVRNSYVGPYGDLNRGNGVEVDSFPSFGLQVSRSLRRETWRWLGGTRLTLGVDNVLDQEPPLDYASAGFRVGNFRRPAGRLFFAEVKKTF